MAEAIFRGAANLGIESMNGPKQRALEMYLGDRPEDLTTLSDIDVAIPVPNLEEEHYRAPQTLDEFHAEVELQDREYPDGKALDRVVRSLAMYAGVIPVEGAEQYFTVHKTLSPETIHPTAQLRLAQRAARVRAIPSNWQEDSVARTPLVVKPNDQEGFVDISFRDTNGETKELYTTKVLEPATPTPLAYVTGEDIMLINPQMVCPLSCSFCIREHTDTASFGLVNFNPKETATYLVEKYNTEEWDKIRMVKLITGAFRDYPTLKRYTSSFLDEIRVATDGKFDPINGDQTMHLLTNLVQTTEELEEMKNLGVESLEHTIEIIDDDKRRQHMRRASARSSTPGKGEQTFDEMMEVAERAVQVYGVDKYGTTVVLGMDNEATTIRGYDAMYDAGVRQSTGGLFVPNAYQEVHLQQTTFAQTMRLRRIAAAMFTLPAVFAPYTDDPKPNVAPEI